MNKPVLTERKRLLEGLLKRLDNVEGVVLIEPTKTKGRVMHNRLNPTDEVLLFQAVREWAEKHD